MLLKCFVLFFKVNVNCLIEGIRLSCKVNLIAMTNHVDHQFILICKFPVKSCFHHQFDIVVFFLHFYFILHMINSIWTYLLLFSDPEQLVMAGQDSISGSWQDDILFYTTLCIAWNATLCIALILDILRILIFILIKKWPPSVRLYVC